MPKPLTPGDIDLSILCITRNEPHALVFLRDMAMLAYNLGAEFVCVLDDCNKPDVYGARFASVKSSGYLESVLDEGIAACMGRYILRLDDDEKVSAPLFNWLVSGDYVNADIFTFARVNLWQDEQHVIANPPLYPDFQTRLTVREKAGGRGKLHSGSPFGPGVLMDYPIEHHKFLVRSYEQRKELAERYERIEAGGGLGEYKVFNLPEDVLDLQIEAYG